MISEDLALGVNTDWMLEVLLDVAPVFCVRQLFDKLRKQQPDFEQKLLPVCGDVMQPNLGIAEDDRRILQEGVNVVFHSAATIKFDETLRSVHHCCCWKCGVSSSLLNKRFFFSVSLSSQ